jgi:hypothetical protein
VNWEYWSKTLRQPERELDAATTRTALDAGAKRYMLAKTELKRLETPKRRCSRGSRSAGASGAPARLRDLEARLLEMIDHPGS